jgi:hypothetical protein
MNICFIDETENKPKGKRCQEEFGARGEPRHLGGILANKPALRVPPLGGLAAAVPRLKSANAGTLSAGLLDIPREWQGYK